MNPDFKLYLKLSTLNISNEYYLISGIAGVLMELFLSYLPFYATVRTLNISTFNKLWHTEYHK